VTSGDKSILNNSHRFRITQPVHRSGSAAQLNVSWFNFNLLLFSSLVWESVQWLNNHNDENILYINEKIAVWVI